jgi:virginiamycin B lyase
VTEVGIRGQTGRFDRATLCAIAALLVFAVLAQSAYAAAPQLSKVSASAVIETAATLKAEIDPKGKNTAYRIEYGQEDCETSGTCVITGQGNISGASSPTVRETLLEGLSPATLYHYRVIATNNEGEAKSGDRIFASLSPTFKGLPDTRAYEQASPVDKNGNDAMGDLATVKATASGGDITFASTFGIPGGKGAQSFPSYLASRGSTNWSTQGLLPPPSVGDRAVVIGWSPDYDEVFSNDFRLGAQKETALFAQSTVPGAEPVQITPYLTKAEFFYSGQSKDGSVVLFESPSKLTPEALGESPNLYAWDRETGEITLAGIRNSGTSPPKGTIAGAYEWTEGIDSQTLRLGGSFRGFYLRDENAIGPDGSIYFTEAGTGQLYRRINPTQEQSAFTTNAKGEERCSEATKACTVHVSFSHKTDGKGPSGTDAAGAQPAAFQAASADGSEAFFTSPEKLTDESNTGPEQPPAQIERDDLAGGSIETPDFIPQRAIGVAVDATQIYWADPQLGTIGRADLTGENADPGFISTGQTKCEIEVSPGVFETREEESYPRYVAVDAKYVYWTHTGCSDEFGPIKDTGTIGRANIDGTPASIEPEFITGASDPQGIAVNATYIYWANTRSRTIGRATIEGKEVDQDFHEVHGNELYPFGVALSPTHVYFSAEDRGNDLGFVGRFPLAGEPQEDRGVGKGGIRGVAVDGSYVYWASQGDEEIGRTGLAVTEGTAEPNFISFSGKPNGLAIDSAHLYWSTNGESPTNPGNDLYRYGPGAGELTDLTPDDTDVNGAEVQGVVAASADGKYVYFAANGVLAAGAQPGYCEGPLGSAQGKCSLYLWHDGAISLVARLDAGASATDALNWAATPRNQFGTASYVPKTSFLSVDGRSLLFRSREQLTAYGNEGVPQFYRFKVGGGIECVTCPPTGEAVGEGPRLGRVLFPGIGPVAAVAAVSSRNFSAGGDQFFFETPEALVPEDTNGQNGCPLSGTGVQFYPACNDVYEWEAAGAGSCKEGSAAFSRINGGCIYLISTGKSPFPSLFADASADGKDVFFFTRQSLVGQDKDELQDVYDARVGGGFASQSPVVAIACESSDACHGPVQTPPSEPAAGSASFAGPGNPVSKRNPQKAKKRKKGRAKKHKDKGGKGKNRR